MLIPRTTWCWGNLGSIVTRLLPPPTTSDWRPCGRIREFTSMLEYPLVNRWSLFLWSSLLWGINWWRRDSSIGVKTCLHRQRRTSRDMRPCLTIWLPLPPFILDFQNRRNQMTIKDPIEKMIHGGRLVRQTIEQPISYDGLWDQILLWVLSPIT